LTGVGLFLLATAGVAAGAALGVRLLGLSGPLDRLIAAALLACAQVVLVSLVAGAVLERFHPGWLLLGTAIWDGALVAGLRRRQARPVGILPTVAAAVRMLAPWQFVVVAACALATIWRLVLAAVLPPFAYDALSYHLTAAASWIQSGTIGPNPYAFCCGRYPSNAEVLFAWPTVLLGRDTLTDAVQIVTAVLGMLAVAGLARTAGISPPGALTAAALYGLTPIVLAQANTDYNDVTIAAFFLAAVYFGARFLAGRGLPLARDTEPPRLAFALLTGVAAGLLLGTKTSGIALAGVVIVPLLAQVALAAWQRRLPGGGFALAAAGLVVGATLLTGGWWYARNWVEVGNPLAPFEVRALGVELFHGTASLHEYLTVPPGGARNPVAEVGRSWYHDLVFWTRSEYSYEERSGGLGPLWSWLGWPLLAWTGLLAIRRRPDLVVSVLLPATLAFAILPYRWWSRFTIYLAALGAVAIVAMLEGTRRQMPRRAFAAGVVVLSLAGGALATWRVDPAGYGDRLAAPDVLSLAVHRDRPRSVGDLFFHEFAWLDGVPARATIGVDVQAPKIRFLYPLFGSRLERHVILFNNGEEGTIDRRLGGAGRAYLFVGSGDAFDRWALARPQRYRPVFTGRGTRVFMAILRR
jgi:hypothetical protein